MLADYGLLTTDMSEKNVVKVLDQKLDTYFRKVADKNYDIYKTYSLKKSKNLGGISNNPKQIPWDYEYMYFFHHKKYGMNITLYPNINEAGEQKFKTTGVVWNLLVNDVPMYFNGITFLKRTNPDLPRFVEYLLKDLPFEVVVNYRYAKGEERV
ncbi:hypothetical protein SAMN06296952_2466 [Oscillospiraceae bacterium]|nr:hypothetical protein SAMN06296952_2466 [Oscillospiraceae bacterium]